MGSVHHRTVIRRENPQRTRLIRLLGALAVLVLAAVAFAFGFQLGQERLGVPVFSDDQYLEQISYLTTRNEVQGEALNQLTVELADSRGVIDELERELAFYREVMAPEEGESGVVLRQPVFRATDDPQRWRYQLVVQQGNKKTEQHRGELEVSVVGYSLGGLETFALAELDESLGGNAIDLNFRYFQRAEGELYLPPGFSPSEVAFTLVLQKPTRVTVESRFPWNELRDDQRPVRDNSTDVDREPPSGDTVEPAVPSIKEQATQ